MLLVDERADLTQRASLKLSTVYLGDLSLWKESWNQRQAYEWRERDFHTTLGPIFENVKILANVKNP